jgi:hypothetical protein
MPTGFECRAEEAFAIGWVSHGLAGRHEHAEFREPSGIAADALVKVTPIEAQAIAINRKDAPVALQRDILSLNL